MTLSQYLKESKVDLITDDKEFCEVEHDTIAEYFEQYEVSEEDKQLAESKGYDISFFISEQKVLINNGYEVKTSDIELLTELQNNPKNIINWYNFESGDSFWSEEGNEYSIITINYDLKIVVLQRCKF